MSQQGIPFLANSYKQIHTHIQDAQSPGARTPMRMNYLNSCLIFVRHQYGNAFIAPTILKGPLDFWKIFGPMYTRYILFEFSSTQ
jgi:hypothetical protein